MMNVSEFFYQSIFTDHERLLSNPETIHSDKSANLALRYKELLPGTKKFKSLLDFQFPSLNELFKLYAKASEECPMYEEKDELRISSHENLLSLLVETFSILKGYEHL